MALWNVKIDDQDWKLVYAPGALTHKEIGLGHKIVVARRFFYHFEHPYLPATLSVNQKGKLVMLPTWEEVHPQTELEDIILKRPEVKVRKERVITQKYNVKNDEGDVYVGYLKNGLMHNYGEYTWSSGDKVTLLLSFIIIIIIIFLLFSTWVIGLKIKWKELVQRY